MNADSRSKHISKRALLLYSQAGLTDEECMGIEEHLADCARCAALARRLGCSVRFLDRFAADPSFLLRVPNPGLESKRNPQPREVQLFRANSKRKPPGKGAKRNVAFLNPFVYVLQMAATVVLLAAVSASVLPIRGTAHLTVVSGGQDQKRADYSQELDRYGSEIPKTQNDLPNTELVKVAFVEAADAPGEQPGISEPTKRYGARDTFLVQGVRPSDLRQNEPQAQAGEKGAFRLSTLPMRSPSREQQGQAGEQRASRLSTVPVRASSKEPQGQAGEKGASRLFVNAKTGSFNKG